MRTRSSSLAPVTPSPLQTLRRSPRFQPHNKSLIIENPKAPKPTSNNTPHFSSTSKIRENFSEQSIKKTSKGVILTSGLRRSPRLNNWVGVSKPLRRSPRFSGKQTCEVSVDKAVQDSEIFSRRVEEDGGLNEAVVEKCGDKGVEKVVEEGLKEEARDLKGDDGEIGEVGKKRKVDDEKSNGVCQGWTRDQELALQKAYFAALPTPHFWKKVSRMVPGKSAQDCFDKVNSDQVTPLQRLPRSRTRITKSSSPAFSASKLLAPIEAESRRLGCNKKRNQLAHKTIRKLLEKQCRVKEDHEVDIFSELEPDVDPSIKTSQARTQPSTPNHIQQNQEVLRENNKTISLGQRNPLSSVNSMTCNAVSPPVLKQVKNKALHEKYIDVLCKREAKRKAIAAKEGKLLCGKENKKGCYLQNIDIIVVKNALVSDARDAISQLQSLRDNATESSSGFDDNIHTDDDEGEDKV